MRHLLLLALLVAPAFAQKPSPVKLSADMKELFDLANKARAKEKAPELQINPVLMKIAHDHAANMAKQEKMDHVLDGKNPSKRALEGGYNYRSIGENIGKAGGDPDVPAPPAANIHGFWMKSKHHRENLLNPKFTEVGLAAVRSKKGTIYYAQVFGTPLRRR
jgi:uncharacterized protein YkwD